MALKAKYKSQEEIPEDARSLYKEVDGAWLLDVEQVDGIGLVDGSNLKSALQKERQRADKAERELKAFEGISDPAAAAAAVKKLEELGDLDSIENLDEAVAKRVELKEQQLTTKFERDKAALEEARKRDVDALTTDRDRVLTQLKQELVTSAAQGALAKHQGNPALLLDTLRNRTSVVDEDGKYVIKVLDPSGNPMMTSELGKSGDMSLDEFVGSLKKSDDYAAAFAGNPAGGSGAGSGGSGGGSGAAATATGPTGGGEVKVFKGSQLKTSEGLSAYKAARAAQEAGTGPAVQVTDG